jgi:hypothetical protein
MSNGAPCTVPPAAVTRLAAASTSSTEMYAVQCGGSPDFAVA